MRAMGAVLVLLGGMMGYLLWRRQAVLPIRLGEALLEDLAVLSYRCCVLREALPWVLRDALGEGLGGQWLWSPLGSALDGERPLPAAWREATAALPPPLDRLLAPLGPLLPVGGQRLETAVDEVREELTRFLMEVRQRHAQEGRITAALCLSGAALLVLVLI